MIKQALGQATEDCISDHTYFDVYTSLLGPLSDRIAYKLNLKHIKCLEEKLEISDE